MNPINPINLNRTIPGRIYAIGKAAAADKESHAVLSGVYVELFLQAGIVHCRIAATNGHFLVQEIIRCYDAAPSDVPADGLVFVLRNWQDLKAVGKQDAQLRGVSLALDVAETGRIRACIFQRLTLAGVASSVTVQTVDGTYPSFASVLTPSTRAEFGERIGLNMHCLAALETLWADKGEAGVVLYPQGRGVLCRPLADNGQDRVALIMPITLPD